MKYGPCSRRRLAPVARLQDKGARMSLCIRVDVHIELSYGSVQLDMHKLLESLGQLTMGTVRFRMNKKKIEKKQAKNCIEEYSRNQGARVRNVWFSRKLAV